VPHQDPNSFPTRRSSDLNIEKEFLYTSDFEYEIVTKKANSFEDIIEKHTAMRTALVSGRGVVNIGLAPDSKQGIYRMNLAEFQRSEEHTSELQSRENLVC